MASSKIEGATREELIAYIEQLEKETTYGLVWEEKTEKVADQCKTELPIIEEELNKALVKDSDEPTNVLIEGDNYHSLSVLNYTHPRKFDLIYIDPPYNTGKKDNIFIYNDRIVDINDTFRHSKWLSFMSRRLTLARDLMKPQAPIFISIDDNEIANLKLLCDKIFGPQNFVASLPTIMNLKGNQDQFGFAGTHEYTLVYCFDKSETKLNTFEIDEDGLDEWEVDDYGYYKKGANLKATGVNAPRTKRPYLYYPILIEPITKQILSITSDEYNSLYIKETKQFNDVLIETLRKKYEDSGFVFLLPITDNELMSWRWSRRKLIGEPFNLILTETDGTFSIYKKQRPSLGDIPSKKPKTIFYKPEYSSGNGTAQLKKIFGKKVFNNPKPVELIKDFLRIGCNKNAMILDFFAGSGTTGQAVLELNREDGGQRQFVLCTNNENNISEKICYPRLKKVIEGYSNVEGIPSNLRYYKNGFISKSKVTDDTRNNLVKRSTEMICLRENTFRIIVANKNFRVFKNKNQSTGILFALDFLNEFKREISELNLPSHIYVFSLTSDTFDEDFSDLPIEYELCPIPESILEVYRRLFKD